MGILDYVLGRNKEIEYMFDLDLLGETTNRVHMKRLAVETCINFLGRTISQSEFRVKQGKGYVKDELYYRLNIRPNKNMTASMFWQTIIYKLIYDNECLVIQGDDGDLLIADDYERNEFAVFEDTFTKVVVKDYEFKRSFPANKVIYLQYNNRSLAPLIDGLFADYGELFGRLVSAQKRKNQIRSTIKIDSVQAKTQEFNDKLQNYINKLYKAIEDKDVAIVPEQKGFEYKEHAGTTSGGQSVEEINKVTDGFLDKVAMAIGIPLGLLHGDMADVDKQTKNYMVFTVNPLIKKLEDEANAKFFTKQQYLRGNQLDIRKVSYQNIFDLSTAIDKLISSGAFTANEMRDAAGWERSDDEKLDRHYITKNYQSLEGGDKE